MQILGLTDSVQLGAGLVGVGGGSQRTARTVIAPEGSDLGVWDPTWPGGQSSGALRSTAISSSPGKGHSSTED